MKFFKSHFWYTRYQRNGIFLLVLLIAILQAFVLFKKEETIDLAFDDHELKLFQKKVDSLTSLAEENARPILFPFNPNYIADFKGSQLGMSIEEIDRLHALRKSGKFINSEEEFKKVTKISDSLLHRISPYFKFPDWVNQRNEKGSVATKLENNREKLTHEQHQLSTRDLNKATMRDLLSVKGMNESLAKRIIKYRSKLRGFYFEEQLYEVFNISSNQVENLLKTFSVLEKPNYVKQNVNTITFKELLKIPYINYELCKRILDYRDQVAELQDIAELKRVEDFPEKQYDRIVLYLTAE